MYRYVHFSALGIIAALAAVLLSDPASAQRLEIDAPIVPRPGDSITLRVCFDEPMEDDLKIALLFPNGAEQTFARGGWNGKGTVWSVAPVKLAGNKGLGRLVVPAVKAADGSEVAPVEEPFLVGDEPLRALLGEYTEWMIEHPIDVIFVEGYYYRTMLALYEITGERRYLQAAAKGADKILDRQHDYGFWGTGYGTIYLADTGSALGLLVNYYKFASPDQRRRIDAALARYRRMVTEKGEAHDRGFINDDGSLGIGFRGYKDGLPVGPMYKSYTIATSLTGAEIFAALYYMHGNEADKKIAVRATDWLLKSIMYNGAFPHIIDEWDPARKHAYVEKLYHASAYVDEGLIAAYAYLDDPALKRRISEAMARHAEWLLNTQNSDGGWGAPRTYDSTRGHGVVNALVWYHENVRRDPRIAAAVRRYYLLLLDDDRESYTEVAAAKLSEWPWQVPGEHVSTSLAGRAVAEIVKPGVDCRNWKDKTK